MKKTLSGLDAFNRIITSVVPDKTSTYTPISHSSIITKMKQEIGSAGLIIDSENYQCSQNGEVAIGNYRINFEFDPDIQMSASFLNSYNKQYAFRFGLGSMVKVCDNGLFIRDAKFGEYKKIHKGEADLLSESTISNYIKTSHSHWENLKKFKNDLKNITLSKRDAHEILGELFFEKDALSTYQLNIVKTHIKKSPIIYSAPNDSAWVLYNHITQSLKEAHPSEWLDRHLELSDLFIESLGITVEPESVASL